MRSNLVHQVMPISRSTGLRDDVASHIIQSIFHGTLKEGDRLIVQKLAESMQVSATPIREALVQLAEIGLVQLVPNRGAICSAFGSKELKEFFQIRRILEVEAVRVVALTPHTETLQEYSERTRSVLAQTLDGESLKEEAAALDDEFHEYLALASGSDRLSHELKRYGMLMHEIRVFIENRRNQQTKAMEEHLIILDALLAGNADAAMDGMSKHLESACAAVDAVMFAAKEA